MSTLDHQAATPHRWHSGFGGFLLRDWPYILMLVLSLAGVAYTSFSQTELYWVLLTPFIGLVCVITRWPQVEGREEHVHLVISQLLHWAAVLAAMQLMSLQVLRQVTGIAGPLSLLTLLALGTFTAGLHIRAWKVCVVGLLLGLSVPAVALLQQSALLILLVVAVLIAIVVPFVWARMRPAKERPEPLRDPASTAYEPPVTPSATAAQSPMFAQPMFAPQPVQPVAAAAPFDTATPPAVQDPIVPEPGSPTSAPEPTDGEPRPDIYRTVSGAR